MNGNIYKNKIFIVKKDFSNIENNKKSLPGSPIWDYKMNPGCMPDGQFCKEKREEFKTGIQRLLLKNRYTNTTFFENAVNRKRKGIFRI